MHARARSAGSDCPHCGSASGRVHGRYMRRLADAAVGGARVVIELLVRRFKCPNPACPAVTFAEQISGLTSPHARYTPLVREQQPMPQPPYHIMPITFPRRTAVLALSPECVRSPRSGQGPRARDGVERPVFVLPGSWPGRPSRAWPQ
ncbi:transposase family protein [Streptomyces brasiliensis]